MSSATIWTRLRDSKISRVNHQAVMFNDMMYIFGGYSKLESSATYHIMQITIAVWDTRLGKWSVLPRLPLYELEVPSMKRLSLKPINDNQNPAPSMRYGHTVVSWSGKAWMIGGRTDRDACSPDLYGFDPSYERGCGCWLRVSRELGKSPPARDGHAATVSGDYLYLFGGFVAGTENYDNSLYQLDFVTWQWTELVNRRNVQTVIPTRRDFPCLTAHEDSLYMYGGRSDRNGSLHTGNEIYDPALWEYQVSTGQWKKLHEGLEQPSPMGRRSACLWGYRSSLYLCFGLNSLLEPVSRQHMHDLWRFNLSTLAWTQLRPFGEKPTARRRAVACCHPQEPRVFFFGGTQPAQGGDGDSSVPMDDDDNEEENTTQSLNDLHDLHECHVLDLEFSLYRLCLHSVIKYGFNIDFLPETIINDIGQIFPVTDVRQQA